MNPYQPPREDPVPQALMSPDGCPKCNSSHVYSPSMTWWGGLLGPKMFKHTICRSCGFGYNRNTRKSNTTAIAIYFVITLTIAAALIAATR